MGPKAGASPYNHELSDNSKDEILRRQAPGSPPMKPVVGAPQEAKHRFFSSPWLRLLLIAAAAGWLGLDQWQRGRHAEESGTVLSAQQVEWDMVLSLFPGAQDLRPLTTDPSLAGVLDANRRSLGTLLITSPRSNRIKGYRGPTPLAIGLLPDGRIAGVRLLPNSETGGFVRQIEATGLFRRWDGLPWQAALDLHVDAVTRATLTSEAVVRTLRHRLSALHPTALRRQTVPAAVDWPAVGLLLAAAALFLAPVRLAHRLRTWLLLAAVLYLGFGRGWFLSLDLFGGWLRYGWSWPGALVPALMAGLALVLPLAARRPFYCYYVCPFGAAQELLFRLSPFKNRWPRFWPRWLSRGREVLLASAAVLLLAGIAVDLSQLEPFSAFLLRAASAWVLLFAGILLALSLVWNRWWCVTLCPTGALLDSFCLRPKPKGVPRAESKLLKKLSQQDLHRTP